MRPAHFFLALSLVAPALPASAQTFTPKKITFVGAPEFKREDLLAVAALKPNTPLTQADVNSAAERLNATSLFTDIRFALDFNGLTYTLTPSTNVLTARFGNFLWWTPAELDAELRHRVPLFTGRVPTDGTVLANVTAALTALVATKGITATISSVPSAPSESAAPDAIMFNITSPPVLVHSLNIENASPAMQPHLVRVELDAATQTFDTRFTPESITTNITTAYRDNGYLDIAVPTIRHAPAEVSTTSIGVDMIATVSEGAIYHLTSLDWEGSPLLSAEDFNNLSKLKPGDVASQSALRQSLGIVNSRYFSKGFMDAKVQATAIINHATHTAAYTIHVTPGEQYRVASVIFIGLNSSQQAELAPNWRLRKGDFYDPEYIATFLKKNSSLRSLAGYSATFKTVSDPNTHLANVTITFVRGGELTN